MAETPTVQQMLSRAKDTRFDNPQGITWSFEFFPPKTEAGVKNLNARLGRMRGMHPEFIDYTWGAGGSTSELTMDLCKTAQHKYGYIANMHLTCTNMEKGKVEEALRVAREAKIRNIVALRGDPPQGQSEWKACDTGFSCALDLVRYIRKETGDHFCLSVAGYPEGHPDRIADYDEYKKTGKLPADVMKGEMDYLKSKIDAGANVIITQMFYDPDRFLQWVKECRAAGIPEEVPIIPGMLPIQNYPGFRKMTGFCKTYIPAELEEQVEAVKPDPALEGDAKKEAEQAFKDFGVKHMTDMCRRLIDGGVRHLHFYTLNQDGATRAVLQNLGLVPEDYSDTTCDAYGEAAREHPAFVPTNGHSQGS
eukprot:TRINITY_DN16936_c1_g1_i1.p1 TRINITY_DN16936_c1_g1~~TRINITY_DN16936_c1_g1_i1.p1  ORF type:complete len:364 (+),score=153.60 TRINITY_DN16936_c1_g1_i1:100-1191(+)